MLKVSTPEKSMTLPSSRERFDFGRVEGSATITSGIIAEEIRTESLVAGTWVFKLPIQTENVSTSVLGAKVTPDELSRTEVEDVEESMREVKEERARCFRNVDDALAWLDGET